jgi:hypothetical protein
VLAPFVVVKILVHAEPPVLLGVGDGSLSVLGDGVSGGILGITRDTVTGRSNVNGGAEGLLPNLNLARHGGVGGRSPLVVAPRPEVVHLGISGILAHVLDDDLTVDLAVGTAPVLVGPLDRQDGTLVVVHLLVLRGTPPTKPCDAILVLEALISNGTRTGISTGGIVLRIEQAVTVITIRITLTISVI